MKEILKFILFFSSFFLNYYTDYLNFFFKKLLDIKQVSVIVPIYNAEKYLVETLNSVITQSLINIEIICIDDGSTDNSPNIIQKYSQLDKRFVFIKQKNIGAGKARNKGINSSRGKFISFLDSDDIYYDNLVLEYLYNNAKKNNAIICGGEMAHIGETYNGSFFKIISFQKEGFLKYKDYQFDFYYQRFMYNRNFLKRNKFYFPNLIRYQDPPFFIRVMFKAKRFYAIKKIIYIYRCKPRKPFNLKQTLDIFYGLNDCLQFAEHMKLYILYCELVKRLNTNLYIQIVKSFSEESNIKKIIYKIIKSINKKIIINNNLNINFNNFYKNYNFSNIALL